MRWPGWVATPRLDEVAWVGQGSPELLPRAPTDQFPCVLVMPGQMEQPFSAGGNRVFQQEYTYHVYWVREYEEGEVCSICSCRIHIWGAPAGTVR